MVTPDYFKTFGIRLINGRSFTEQDNAASVKVAMVNEEFVRKYLKGTDPLQQRVIVEQLIPGVQQLGRRSSGRSWAYSTMCGTGCVRTIRRY